MAGSIEIVDIILPLEVSENKSRWKSEAAKKLKIDVSHCLDIRLLKHSIDARQQKIKINRH